MVLTGSESGDVRGWDTGTGQPIPGADVSGPSLVTALAFSPDGTRFAVGYENGTSQLFDAGEFQPLGPPTQQGGEVCRIALSDDGQSWTTVLADGTPRTWHAPTPLQGSPQEITEMFRVYTGLAIDENQMGTQLSLQQWQRLRDALTSNQVYQHGLPRPSAAAWQEARARDAEDNRQWFIAQRHLNRLIASASDDWLLYARRAHVHVQRDEFSAAEMDYATSTELLQAKGEHQRLDLWYRQQAVAARNSQNWRVAGWYLDRLLENAPNDEQLRADRAAIQE